MTDKNCHEIPPAACELITVQCDRCGFHLGLDASYLRGLRVKTLCPSCGLELEIDETE